MGFFISGDDLEPLAVVTIEIDREDLLSIPAAYNCTCRFGD